MKISKATKRIWFANLKLDKSQNLGDGKASGLVCFLEKFNQIKQFNQKYIMSHRIVPSQKLMFLGPIRSNGEK